MNKLLALAAIAALVAACAGIAQTSGDMDPAAAGAAEAADLGYHGPLNRARTLYGN
jgi:opacity protein-like surface antigen